MGSMSLGRCAPQQRADEIFSLSHFCSAALRAHLSDESKRLIRSVMYMWSVWCVWDRR